MKIDKENYCFHSVYGKHIAYFPVNVHIVYYKKFR